MGCPVMDAHQYTQDMIFSLNETIADKKNFTLVIIDNGSMTPYGLSDDKFPFTIDVIRNKENRGYYYPLKQLHAKYPDADYIGLLHNDMRIYTYGWDRKMVAEFERRPRLGLIGLYGAQQVDYRGWDERPVARFRDENEHKKGTHAKRIKGLTPVVTIDSLFMLLPRRVISYLNIDENILFCHFYDKIWCFRLHEAGLHAGVLGCDFEHQSSITSKTEAYYKSVQDWWEKQGIEVKSMSPSSADWLLQFDGARRYQIEYRDIKKMFPCKVDKDFELVKI